MTAAPSMAEVLAERWGCTPGRVDEQYGPLCNSSNHTLALYGPTGCEFAADAAQALADAGFGHVRSEPETALSLAVEWKARATAAERALAAAEAQVADLQRWKDEALPVMSGLQELGRALDLPLGERITGERALEAVEALVAQVAAVRAARAQHPTCDRHDDSPVSCGWQRVVLDIDAVLDGEGGR